jgi:hypothetical protein
MWRVPTNIQAISNDCLFRCHEALSGPGAGRAAIWRQTPCIPMSRNAGSAADFVVLSPNRVVTMGAQEQAQRVLRVRVLAGKGEQRTLRPSRVAGMWA